MEEKKSKLEINLSPKNTPQQIFPPPFEKITRLRIPEDLIYHKELIQNIAKTIGGKVKIESYIQESDFKKSFKARQLSLFKACQFMISTLMNEEKKGDMLKTLRIITQNNPMPNVECPENYQKILFNYKQKLIELCGLYFKNHNPKEIIECINKAEQYVILQEGRQDLATLTRCEHSKFKGFSVQWEQQRPAFDSETLKAFHAIKTDQTPPKWYFNLPEAVQKFLKKTLTTYKTLEESLRFLSSRQRELPGIPNHAESFDLLLDEKGQLLKKSAPISRSGHLASRDILHWDEALQNNYCQSNLNIILNTSSPQKITYIGTYISPHVIPLAKSNVPVISNLSNLLDNMIPMIVSLPDKKLHERLEKTINQTRTNNTIYFTNHPQNMARASDYTAADDPHCLKILKDAKKISEKNPNLKPLIEAYENALNSGLGTSYVLDYNGRELNLAAIECLLIQKMGGRVHITCVSGKDRTALVIIYIKAMREFHLAYGEWPLYSDTGEKRAAFVDIYAKLYCSGHGQTFAGDNAPGSDGIKTPATYLPKDIAEAIKKIRGEHCLKDDDMLATNNEFGKIKLLGSQDYYPACLHAAKKLSLEQCETLISQLKILSCDNQLWQGKKQKHMFSSFTSYIVSDMPEGLRQIKTILTKPNEEKTINTPFKTLAQIYAAILNRPENSEQRNGITNTLYTLIKELCCDDNPCMRFKDISKAIGKINFSSTQEQETVFKVEMN